MQNKPQSMKTADRHSREPVWLYVIGVGIVLGRCRLIYDGKGGSALLSAHKGWVTEANPETELFPEYWAPWVEDEVAPPWPCEE